MNESGREGLWIKSLMKTRAHVLYSDQLKIQCNVKMGPPPPPGGLPAKRGDDTGMSSEDDGLPRSPPEMSLLHDIGPGTTIKASTACTRLSTGPHRCRGPRASPVVGGRARCGGRSPAQVTGAHSGHLFSLFEQKCRPPLGGQDRVACFMMGEI